MIECINISVDSLLCSHSLSAPQVHQVVLHRQARHPCHPHGPVCTSGSRVRAGSCSVKAVSAPMTSARHQAAPVLSRLSQPPMDKRCCLQEYFAAKLTSYAPLQLGTPEYADALNISSTLGAKDSTQRTPYQTDTAFFWEDGDGDFFDQIDRRIQGRYSRCSDFTPSAAPCSSLQCVVACCIAGRQAFAHVSICTCTCVCQSLSSKIRLKSGNS